MLLWSRFLLLLHRVRSQAIPKALLSNAINITHLPNAVLAACSQRKKARLDQMYGFDLIQTGLPSSKLQPFLPTSL